MLFHHGVPTQAGRLGRLEGDRAREQLTRLALPAAAQQQIQVALAIVEHLNAQLRWSSSATRAGCMAAAP